MQLYQSAVCKLLYLSTRSCPDIAYAVSGIARFTANPTKEHWKALKHIFSRTDGIDCSCYSDADWGSDLDDRKSTSGCVSYWRRTSQLAKSKLLWLRRLIAEVYKKPAKAMVIQEDNQLAICLTKNPQFHGRSKHIAIKYHFIREQVKEGMIRVEYCKTEDMLADIFSKGLFGERFKRLRNLNGMIELDTSTLSWEGVFGMYTNELLLY
uniref:Reverse transcriptase Ty1/copia-type domain-containing protein n=1 Tax=Amphimedon queenslandica TaxID=400682 RepID=A0A1X7U2X2_AMPQE